MVSRFQDWDVALQAPSWTIDLPPIGRGAYEEREKERDRGRKKKKKEEEEEGEEEEE